MIGLKGAPTLVKCSRIALSSGLSFVSRHGDVMRLKGVNGAFLQTRLSSNESHQSSQNASHGLHGQEAKHAKHEKDPYETWYEFPPHVEVTRHSRMKIPFYVGQVPTASYREPDNNDFWFMRWQAVAMATFMWAWITWSWLWEPGHVTGEWFIPDRYVWTDEELGIPSTDAGPAPKVMPDHTA